MNAIFKRRSVRSYKEGNVTEEQVQRMLAAAMRAPSAGNEQPWHFVVVRDRETLAQIPTVHPFSKMLNSAALAIVICGAPEEQVYEEEFWVQDCAAAMENLQLEIVEQGLGGVWLAIYPIQDRISGMRRILGIPENIVPFAIASIGHPKEEREHADTFKPEKIHMEKW